jgi:hypothetical protein
MARLSARKIAAKAAQGFQVFQCEECARQIRESLQRAGFHGRTIEICAARDFDYILCNSYAGGKSAITMNGRHLGVRVQGFVFDNLHPDGMRYDEWLRDFDAPYGIEIVSDTRF